MSRRTSILNRVRVASPCPASWERMEGDDRVRFCALCRLNVYNLSGMSRQEAEDLIRQNQGRLCVRYYQRADGTMLTQDCPVGLQALRKRVATLVMGAFALWLGLISLASVWGRKPGSGEAEVMPWETLLEQAERMEPIHRILVWIDPTRFSATTGSPATPTIIRRPPRTYYMGVVALPPPSLRNGTSSAHNAKLY